MALLCRVVAAPSSSCVAAARWSLGIEEPLNETETERELQTEKRREHLQSWAGLPQLGGEDNGQGWNRKGGDVCSVHLLGSRVTNICLCGLPLNELRRGGGDLAVLVQMACQVCWCCWLAWECVHQTGLNNIPQLATFFANFRLQLLRTKKVSCYKQAAGFCL